MEETEHDDQVANMLTALKVDQADRNSTHVDVVTVDRATRSIIQNGETISIASTDEERRNSQIEAAIEIINRVKKAQDQRHLSRANSEQHPASNTNGSCGLVLNSEMISLGGNNAGLADGFIKVGKVLGKGNSSGEVIVVKDSVTKREVAYKTVLVSQFNDDEIRAWIRLGDADMAPELYHFRLIDGKFELSMEPLAGLTMEQATEYWGAMYNHDSCIVDKDSSITDKDSSITKHSSITDKDSSITDKDSSKTDKDSSITEKLSLWVLNNLLEMLEKLKPFSHGDIHAGNIFLEQSMIVKMIDFGRARNMTRLSPQNRIMTMRNDLVGIIRIFCTLYSGVDFNDIFDAKKQLASNDLSKLSEGMYLIPEYSRVHLFKIMSMLYDTVRDPNQEGFGDTSCVATYVKSLLPEDVETFKKKVAVILFPEKYQIEADDVDSDETDGQSSDIFTWDSPYMEDCIKNVKLKDLQTLGVKPFFF